MPYKNPEKAKKYGQKHYQDNKEYYYKKGKKAKRKARERNKAFVNKVKTLFGCRRCGYDKSFWALEFHHKDETQKDLNISRLQAGGWSLRRIKEEIRKCVVLCANCHREVHEEIKEGKEHDWE